MKLSNKKGLWILVLVIMMNLGCNPHGEKNKVSDDSDSLVTIQKLSTTEQKTDSYNHCKILDDKIFTYMPQHGNNNHSFTLKFECHQDTLKGLIFGPNPEGEHGLSFYIAELQNLIVDDSLNIAFLFVPGKLYEEQITLENYTKMKGSAGFLRSEISFKGKFLKDTAIALNCFSEYNDCYTPETMLFKLQGKH